MSLNFELTPEMIEAAEKRLADEKAKEEHWKRLPHEIRREICENQLGGHQWVPMGSDEAYPMPYGEICHRCNTSWRGFGPKDFPK